MNIVPATEDGWRIAADGETGAGLLLSPPQWRAVEAAWPADVAPGLVLDNGVEPRELGLDLSRFATIALRFPKWTDGRAYTQARLLRRRLGWAGELRAVGDVVVDMVQLLERGGFDVAVLREGQDAITARRLLGFFERATWHYQGDLVDPQPVFRKEAA